MSLLFRVIRAAHATGTHHKLALDALRRIHREDAEAWQRLFLKHATVYLAGSKAPDTEFKDFKNHVLHVADGYWGGAPEKAEAWYAHLVTALGDGNWQEAAYCAGVLSHYVTDPIHPFHTAQSEAENNIHRAVEWSISRSYDDLAHRGEARAAAGAAPARAPEGEHWLKAFLCANAERANADYGRLIAHYDINVGVVDPPEGLDEIARDLVGDLLVLAADAFARVLERAISQSGAQAPDVSLALDTVIATLTIPKGRLAKRLANAQDRRIVEAMYDELVATGRVDAALPEDDRVVRDLHAREVLAPRAAEQRATLAQRLPAKAPATAKGPGKAVPPAAGAGRPELVIPKVSSPPPSPAATTQSPQQRFAAALGSTAHGKGTPSVMARLQRASPLATGGDTKPAPATDPATPLEHGAPSARVRVRLAAGDDVERAPSIGPRTAERLAAVSIRTVSDLLAADAVDVARRIDARHITARDVTAWQDQARLVMAVPGLSGSGAQLLVGAGYRNIEAIAEADPVALSATVLAYAATTDGRHVLREGAPPDIERIKSWIENAGAAQAA
ncbi:MAG: DUF4332 domain-containing protein [Hyphomicrobiaceae bacterium]